MLLLVRRRTPENCIHYSFEQKSSNFFSQNYCAPIINLSLIHEFSDQQIQNFQGFTQGVLVFILFKLSTKYGFVYQLTRKTSILLNKLFYWKTVLTHSVLDLLSGPFIFSNFFSTLKGCISRQKVTRPLLLTFLDNL